MKIVDDFPACKLPLKLRGHLPRGTRVQFIISTHEEISASLAEGFTRMRIDREKLVAEGNFEDPIA